LSIGLAHDDFVLQGREERFHRCVVAAVARIESVVDGRSKITSRTAFGSLQNRSQFIAVIQSGVVKTGRSENAGI